MADLTTVILSEPDQTTVLLRDDATQLVVKQDKTVLISGSAGPQGPGIFSDTIDRIETMTQLQYDNLPSYDPRTFYVIVP